MLENSDLSQLVVHVSEADAKNQLIGLKKNSQLIDHMRKRLAWQGKVRAETNAVEKLLSSDIANFLLSSPAIRVSFNYDPQLSPKLIQVTSADVAQIKQDQKYVFETKYKTEKFLGKTSQTVADAETSAANQKLDDTLPLPPGYNNKITDKKQFKKEPTRLMISLGKNITKDSSSLKKLENNIRETYKKEMAYLLVSQEHGENISYGSSRNASLVNGVGQGARRTAAKVGRF